MEKTRVRRSSNARLAREERVMSNGIAGRIDMIPPPTEYILSSSSGLAMGGLPVNDKTDTDAGLMPSPLFLSWILASFR